MTLPSSGSISTAQIQAEIGDTGSITIPDANTRTLTGKSTGALIIPNDFWGKTWGGGGGGSGASLNDQSIFGFGGAIAVATYTVHSDGKVYDHDGILLETWRDSGASGDYQIRVTHQSGSTPSGTLNSWLALSSTRSWSLTNSTQGYIQSVLQAEIRNASTLTVLTTATITLAAEADGSGGGFL